MIDIFISYAQQDRARVKYLVDALTKEQFKVWWDLEVCAGASFDEIIEKNLKHARCVLVIWSTYSVKSRWVRAESSWARDHNRLVSIRIDEDLELPAHFYNVHTAGLVNWKGSKKSAAYRKLVADILKVTGPPLAPSHDEQPEQRADPTTDVKQLTSELWHALLGTPSPSQDQLKLMLNRVRVLEREFPLDSEILDLFDALERTLHSEGSRYAHVQGQVSKLRNAFSVAQSSDNLRRIRNSVLDLAQRFPRDSTLIDLGDELAKVIRRKEDMYDAFQAYREGAVTLEAVTFLSQLISDYAIRIDRADTNNEKEHSKDDLLFALAPLRDRLMMENGIFVEYVHRMLAAKTYLSLHSFAFSLQDEDSTKLWDQSGGLLKWVLDVMSSDEPFLFKGGCNSQEQQSMVGWESLPSAEAVRQRSELETKVGWLPKEEASSVREILVEILVNNETNKLLHYCEEEGLLTLTKHNARDPTPVYFSS